MRHPTAKYSTMKETPTIVYWKLPVKNFPQTQKLSAYNGCTTNRKICICRATCWWLPLFLSIRHMKFTLKRIQRHHPQLFTWFSSTCGRWLIWHAQQHRDSLQLLQNQQNQRCSLLSSKGKEIAIDITRMHVGSIKNNTYLSQKKTTHNQSVMLLKCSGNSTGLF